MNKTQISAEIIADSLNPKGVRITSFVLTFPRIILAELNTHRAFSRNSASSRAIPFEKMVKRVTEDPFIPIKWMKDHKGMQGVEFLENEIQVDSLNESWLDARDNAVDYSKELSSFGLTKQICNRLLEPFMWHKAIVTATDFENFFALRANNAAEIHFQKLAYCMLDAMNESKPKSLKVGEWHIPFGDKMNLERLESQVGYDLDGSESSDEEFKLEVNLAKLKIATSRCARVSYLNFEGMDDYNADINLYNQLLESGHMSPFEHCAQVPPNGKSLFTYFGNFKGFIQLRKTIEGENRVDDRLIKSK